MPAPEITDLLQKAVVWEALLGQPDNYGQFQHSAPREIACRWVAKTAVMRDGNGNPITVDATVVVKEKINLGSSMWLGKLEEFLGTGSAEVDQDATVMDVVAYNETPSIHKRVTRRTLGLKFRKNEVPTNG